MADTKPLQAMPAGVYVMCITPFNRDGSIDEGAFREHIRWLAREKIGLFIAGAGYGEGPAMTEPEIWRVFDIAVHEVKGKTPIVAAGHENPNAVRNTRFGREAQARGIDWYHLYPCTPGHSNVPSRQMLEVFYQEVLSEVSMPVTISSNLRTGFEVPLEVHAALIDKWPQVIGFHKSHPNPGSIERFLRAIAPRKPVLVSSIMFNSYALGSKGYLGQAPNLTPRVCRALFDAFMAGDTAKAVQYYNWLNDFSSGLEKIAEHSVSHVKAAMNIMGRPAGHPRRPYLPVSDSDQKALARLLDELEVRKREGI